MSLFFQNVNKLPSLNICLSCAFLGSLLMASLPSHAKQCPGSAHTVFGSVYCDNQFTLWVNGEKVAHDPVAFTPHQAVNVSFEWDGKSSITYAIQCEDYASNSGFEYTQSNRPQLGDGALIAKFDDTMNSFTSAQWKIYTVTYGPTQASVNKGCSANNLQKCEIEDHGTPSNWFEPNFDDSQWQSATTYSAFQAGWGRTPSWSSERGCCTLTSPLDRSSLGCDKSVAEKACLVPRDIFANSDANFIWAKDLERDNRVLFRYTAVCDSQ